MTHAITLRVNGTLYDIEVEPRTTLADALREDCGLTGTHLGCEHGVCGACTVLLDGKPVRACLLFAVQCTEASVRTVEGLAGGDDPHPLQEAFNRYHGLQCGFCTPGFLMLAAGMLERPEVPTEQELREALASNLCRCTGNEAIYEAVSSVAALYRSLAAETDDEPERR